MKRILRVTNVKTGQMAEGELAVWITTMVAMMPPEQRDAYLNAIRNNVDCVRQQSHGLDGQVMRGEVFGHGFVLKESEG